MGSHSGYNSLSLWPSHSSCRNRNRSVIWSEAWNTWSAREREQTSDILWVTVRVTYWCVGWWIECHDVSHKLPSQEHCVVEDKHNFSYQIQPAHLQDEMRAAILVRNCVSLFLSSSSIRYIMSETKIIKERGCGVTVLLTCWTFSLPPSSITMPSCRVLCTAGTITPVDRIGIS